MSSVWDQLADLLSRIGPAGTGLAVMSAPVLAGAAAYVTRMGTQAKIDRLEGEIERIKTSAAEDLVQAERKLTELNGRYQAILRSGTLLQGQIEAIDKDVTEIADRLDAADYAVLVPAPTSIPGDAPDQLVFLCASGPQASTLRTIRVPVSGSLSGEVYRSGKTTIASPSPSSGFSHRTDKITHFKTSETLSVCLRHRNGRVGVAQFLNKRSGNFNSIDADNAEALVSSLAIRVADFISDPRRLVEIGYSPRRNQYCVTSLFVDLTNYSRIFTQMDSSVIIDLLNQYFQTLCSIAMKHGGSIDQFIGDGVLLLFNMEQNQPAHKADAFKAALEMRAAFRELRQKWVTLGYPGAEMLFVRFGLACGPVTRTELGHSQARRLTVIGPAINAAAFACENGPRDRDTVCMTAEMVEALASDFKLDAVSFDTSGTTVFEARD